MKYGRQIAIALAFASPFYSTIAQAAVSTDDTDDELRRCLDSSASASTAGQIGCEVAAYKAYDRRMNTAYTALLRSIHRPAVEKLREAQRVWLCFRNAQIHANSAFFATRQGTMYVPMQAAAQTTIVKDRAIALEAQLRILQIED